MATPFAGLRQQIASWFSRQTNSITKVQGFGNTEVYPTIDSTTAITKGFNHNAAVYAIITRDAKKFGSIPRFVYKTSKAEEKADDRLEGPLTELINRPNEYESQDAFFAKLRAYYKVCGESFIWLNRGVSADGVEDYQERLKMPVLEMFVLPANKIIVVPDETLFGVYGYILETNSRFAIHKADVIHWKALNLNFDAASKDQLRGMSPLKAGFKTLEQNNSATDAAVRMYQNDGAKGVLAEKSLVKLTPTQESQIRDVIDRKINNVDMKGAVAGLQGDWTYLNLGGTSVDLELLEGKEMSMRELCFLFGMPYEFFDSKTPYADKTESQKKWLTNEIIPDCKQLDGEMNRNLLPGFKLVGVAFIATDYSDLPELQVDMAALSTALSTAWWITPNEKRLMMSQEEIKDPELDEIWPPPGMMPMSKQDDGSDDILNEMENGRGSRSNA